MGTPTQDHKIGGNGKEVYDEEREYRLSVRNRYILLRTPGYRKKSEYGQPEAAQPLQFSRYEAPYSESLERDPWA